MKDALYIPCFHCYICKKKVLKASSIEANEHGYAHGVCFNKLKSNSFKYHFNNIKQSIINFLKNYD